MRNSFPSLNRSIVLGCLIVLASAARPGVAADTQSLSQLVTELVLAELPREHRDDRKWGKQKRIQSGLDISTKSWQIRTKRRWKDVNHGTWYLYTAKFVEPEKNFRVQIENLAHGGPGRTTFDIVVTTPLDIFGRMSQWSRGVQLVSLSADARATVRLKLSCQVDIEFDYEPTIPDVTLTPLVTAADLDLREFRLHSISKAHGPLVDELGDELKKYLQRRLDEEQPKLVSKCNRAIDKNTDKLRLSLTEYLQSQWEEWKP